MFCQQSTLVTELEQSLKEAGEAFEQKEEAINRLESTVNGLQTENKQLVSEVVSLKDQLAGTTEKEGSVFRFVGKENMVGTKSALPTLDCMTKAASTGCLSSIGTHAHQVTSTCHTPYKAMHTKSSLLRLHAAHNSPSKVNRCLDRSCYANSQSTALDGSASGAGQHKPSGLASDTRATKKRKSATRSKRNVSKVLRRVYETRSRAKRT